MRLAPLLLLLLPLGLVLLQLLLRWGLQRRSELLRSARTTHRPLQRQEPPVAVEVDVDSSPLFVTTAPTEAPPLLLGLRHRDAGCPARRRGRASPQRPRACPQPTHLTLLASIRRSRLLSHGRNAPHTPLLPHHARSDRPTSHHHRTDGAGGRRATFRTPSLPRSSSNVSGLSGTSPTFSPQPTLLRAGGRRAPKGWIRSSSYPLHHGARAHLGLQAQCLGRSDLPQAQRTLRLPLPTSARGPCALPP